MPGGNFWESLWNWLSGSGWHDNSGIGADGNKTSFLDIEGQPGTSASQTDAFYGDSQNNSGWPSVPGGIGNFMNDITGTTAAQQYQSEEAEKQRDWETLERTETQVYNSAEAQAARDFQEYMDSTQVQRRMEDLQAAGLNPMAMVAGGNFMSGGSSGTTAASASAGHGASAAGSGNSAAAVGGMIRALASLVSAIAKA